jgi:hypothetical protein
MGKRSFGIAGEAQKTFQTCAPARCDWNCVHLGSQSALGPAFGVKVDSVPGEDQVTAEVGNVGLGAPSCRVDSLKVQGQVHVEPLSHDCGMP